MREQSQLSKSLHPNHTFILIGELSLRLYGCIFCAQTVHANLLLALLVQQFAHVVKAAGDGALVGVGVLQVLIGNVGTGQEGAFGLVQAALVHQDDACVQVGRCGETRRGYIRRRFLHHQSRRGFIQNS